MIEGRQLPVRGSEVGVPPDPGGEARAGTKLWSWERISVPDVRRPSLAYLHIVKSEGHG